MKNFGTARPSTQVFKTVFPSQNLKKKKKSSHNERKHFSPTWAAKENHCQVAI
jgi:hypothetical protein